MSTLTVNILRLEPMRVAAFHAYSTTPEVEAWDKLQAWSRPRGLLQAGSSHRIFGFNNPNPSVGSPHYGYEFWIEIGNAELTGVVDPSACPSVEFKHFDGGLYAVTDCVGVDQIGATWQQLVAWCEGSRYRIGHHQWLEEHRQQGEIVPEQLRLILYLPIAE